MEAFWSHDDPDNARARAVFEEGHSRFGGNSRFFRAWALFEKKQGNLQVSDCKLIYTRNCVIQQPMQLQLLCVLSATTAFVLKEEPLQATFSFVQKGPCSQNALLRFQLQHSRQERVPIWSVLISGRFIDAISC